MEEGGPHAKLKQHLLKHISAPDVIAAKYKKHPEKQVDFVDDLDHALEVFLRVLGHDRRLQAVGVRTIQFAVLSLAQLAGRDQAFADAIADYVEKRFALGPRRDQMLPAKEVENSLKAFRRDHPRRQKTAFIIMRFGSSRSHSKVLSAIRRTLKTHGIVGLRADDKQYHDDLLYNILTYVFGCSFSIAIFERIETEQFNPNVSFEVGYAMAIDKPVCLLKDRTLKTLQTDLMGKLYREFDPHDPRKTIQEHLGKWILEMIR
jgi:hypothetical protein